MLNWWLPEGISTYSGKVDGIFYIILAITGLMFFLVEGAILFFCLRYRHTQHAKATFVEGNTKLEVIWTLIPAAILIFLMFKSQGVWSEMKSHMPANPDLHIEVTAQQFAWNIHYPDSEVTTLNQLHIPVGKKVLVQVTSKDVIHSFFIPQFRLKQDAVPGSKINVWFEATQVGHYELVCAEFCGLAHYRMRGYLKIETPEEFQAWLDQSKKEAEKKGDEDEW